MAEIVSIKKLRENSNPDIFIETVLNSPARLERLRQNRERMAEQARKEAEKQEQERKAQDAFNTFVLKLSIGFSFVVTVAAVYVALVF